MSAKYRPVEAIPWFAKRSERAQDRIRKANPYGVKAGWLIMGWHPHDKINHFEQGTVPVHEFIRRFGRDAYRALPERCIYRRGHRKAVRLTVTYQIAE